MPKKTQKEIYETIVVEDTSALISLAVGSVLLKCLRISRILIPQEVYSELSALHRFNVVVNPIQRLSEKYLNENSQSSLYSKAEIFEN
ncbi:MAG: hypothetical protein HF976_03060 [ANME-2 cluster archaeon]|nr:hypothetical protein [ANME-2 cluster archaeon]MBC2700383.1 hypothetical protein [ANME-2 cluster archaeon]MBC2707027.1 hypothetical protein [ANME-2 cluster archaeon]MBC2748022.1 hypothetical protein [ANME-2 cluster archaeon]